MALDVVNKVGLTKQKEESADIILKLYDLFLKKDALLIEVNPYAESISTGGCKCDIFVFFFYYILNLVHCIENNRFLVSFYLW